MCLAYIGVVSYKTRMQLSRTPFIAILIALDDEKNAEGQYRCLSKSDVNGEKSCTIITDYRTVDLRLVWDG